MNHLLVILPESSYTLHRNLIYRGPGRTSEMAYRNTPCKICFASLLDSIVTRFSCTLPGILSMTLGVAECATERKKDDQSPGELFCITRVHETAPSQPLLELPFPMGVSHPANTDAEQGLRTTTLALSLWSGPCHPGTHTQQLSTNA